MPASLPRCTKRVMPSMKWAQIPAMTAPPLGDGTSAGVHESQSRTWENVVGRSLPVWKHYYPKLQATFPEQLGNVELETFYHAINKVKPSLIRVEADEVTYNLHVIIRFELECELLEGTLSIADLPEAWRARYQEYLGVSSPNDTDGVLQDVHWYAGVIGGAFQGYTLGNIFADNSTLLARSHPRPYIAVGTGQLCAAAHLAEREYLPPWAQIYSARSRQRVTGGPIQLAPYQEYLTTKYGAIYNL